MSRKASCKLGFVHPTKTGGTAVERFFAKH